MTPHPNRCPYCGSPTTTTGHHIPAPPPFPLDAEQIVRCLGFLVTLARQVIAKPGEAIPSVDRLTLDLGAAMGVHLPTRQDGVAVTPGGTTVRSGLLPYGATSIPAALDRETA